MLNNISYIIYRAKNHELVVLTTSDVGVRPTEGQTDDDAMERRDG